MEPLPLLNLSHNCENQMQISEHFKREELQCSCCGLFNCPPRFVAFLEQVRRNYAKPMIINSACRCEKKNKEVHGSIDSAHLHGLAVDCHVDNGIERRDLVEAAIIARATGIGVYSTWVHIDLKERPYRVIW